MTRFFRLSSLVLGSILCASVFIAPVHAADAANPTSAQSGAQTSSNSGTTTPKTEDITQKQKETIDNVVMLIHGIVYVTWFIIGLMGDLLSNDIVMSPQVLPILKFVWTLLRNILNTFAVFWMLYIAFASLFVDPIKGKDHETVKSELPQLALALVLINFSWLGMVAIIDASTVAITYSFSITDIAHKSGVATAGLCKSGDTNSKCMYVPVSTQANKEPVAINSIAGPLSDKKYDPKATKNPELRPSMKSMFFLLEEGNTDVSNLAKLNGIDTENTQSLGNNGDCQAYYKAINQDVSACSSLDGFLRYKRNTAIFLVQVKKYDDSLNITNKTIVPIISQNLLSLEQLVTRDRDTTTLSGLVLQTLFSIIMGLAIAVAFIALFIVLLIRVVVLWAALAGSSLLALYFFSMTQGTVKKYFDEALKMAFIPAAFGVIFSITFMALNQLAYQVDIATQVGDMTVIFSKGVLTDAGFLGLFIQLLIIVVFWMCVFMVLGEAPIIGGVMKSINSTVVGGVEWLAKVPMYMNIVPVVDASGAQTGNASIFDSFTAKWKAVQQGLNVDRDASQAALRQQAAGRVDEKSMNIAINIGKKEAETLSADTTKLTALRTVGGVGSAGGQVADDKIQPVLNSDYIKGVQAKIKAMPEYESASTEQKHTYMQQGIRHALEGAGMTLDAKGLTEVRSFVMKASPGASSLGTPLESSIISNMNAGEAKTLYSTLGTGIASVDLNKAISAAGITGLAPKKLENIYMAAKTANAATWGTMNNDTKVQKIIEWIKADEARARAEANK